MASKHANQIDTCKSTHRLVCLASGCTNLEGEAQNLVGRVTCVRVYVCLYCVYVRVYCVRAYVCVYFVYCVVCLLCLYCVYCVLCTCVLCACLCTCVLVYCVVCLLCLYCVYCVLCTVYVCTVYVYVYVSTVYVSLYVCTVSTVYCVLCLYCVYCVRVYCVHVYARECCYVPQCECNRSRISGTWWCTTCVPHTRTTYAYMTKVNCTLWSDHGSVAHTHTHTHTHTRTHTHTLAHTHTLSNKRLWHSQLLSSFPSQSHCWW